MMACADRSGTARSRYAFPPLGTGRGLRTGSELVDDMRAFLQRAPAAAGSPRRNYARMDSPGVGGTRQCVPEVPTARESARPITDFPVTLDIALQRGAK